MMRLRIVWGLIFQLAFLATWGQSANALLYSTPVADTLRVMPVDTWLWEITHPDFRDTSYLYAILPELPGDQFEIPAEVYRFARNQEKLVLAIDPRNPPLDNLHRVEVPLDSTLEELLVPADYLSLKAWVKDSLSSLSYYKFQMRYPPSVLERQFMKDYCLSEQDQPPTAMVEYTLLQELKLPLLKIGTDWTRIAWLDVYSYQAQTWHLWNTYQERAIKCEIYQAMLRAYFQQDLDRVWLLAQSAPDLGYKVGGLLEARNEAWVKTLALHLPMERLLIAVNAAQLAGEYGMIHQLRKQGYRFKPIYLSPNVQP